MRHSALQHTCLQNRARDGCSSRQRCFLKPIARKYSFTVASANLYTTIYLHSIAVPRFGPLQSSTSAARKFVRARSAHPSPVYVHARADPGGRAASGGTKTRAGRSADFVSSARFFAAPRCSSSGFSLSRPRRKRNSSFRTVDPRLAKGLSGAHAPDREESALNQ